MLDEYVPVTVSVPASRITNFYETFATWLAGSGDKAPQGSVARPWQPGDEDAAVDFYGSVSKTARMILDYWAVHPGEWLSGDATATAVEVNGPKGVAGSLSSVGKAAAKMRRALPFEHQPGEPGTSGNYRMRPEVARMFRAAKVEEER